MKFKTYLNELFNTDVPIRLKYSDGEVYTQYEFIVDEEKYTVDIVGFNRMIDGVLYHEIGFADSRKSIKITGRQEFKAGLVFSAVIKCVREFIKKQSPEYFYFTAKETSRKKLYDTFSKMIIKETNYKLQKDNSLIVETFGLTGKVYLFKK